MLFSMATSSLERPVTGLKLRINIAIRHAIGLTQDPPVICPDPELSYMPVDGVARLVNGDLASMLVGGIASLFFQMIHPYAMAGVAQHSRFQHDPFGRMLQTANFIGFTTYGEEQTARAAIERVLAVHEAVRGTADDGVAYYANDPELLRWVHCAEIAMFLEGFRVFGHTPLLAGEQDAYVAEMSRLAEDFSIPNPPLSLTGLNEQLESFRPVLRLSADGVIARDWLRRDVITKPGQRLVFWFITRSALTLLPPWARDILGAGKTTKIDRYLVVPVMRLLGRFIHYVVPPTNRVTLEN
jgi:uncharacterized protein (DUF2236 family)